MVPRCWAFCLPVCKVALAVSCVSQCSTMAISGGQDPSDGISQIAGQRPLPNGSRATTCTNPYLRWTLGYVVTMPERHVYDLGLPSGSDPSVGVRCATRASAPFATWTWEGRYHSRSSALPKLVQPGGFGVPGEHFAHVEVSRVLPGKSVEKASFQFGGAERAPAGWGVDGAAVGGAAVHAATSTMVTIASMVASTASALRFTGRLGFAAAAHLRLYSVRVAAMIRSLK